MRRVAVILILLVPLTFVQAGGDDVKAELQVHGLGRFTGTLTAEGEMVGTEFYTWNATNGPSLTADAQTLRYELWDVPYIRYTLERDNPLGAQWYELLMDPELVQKGSSRGPLHTHPGFQDEGVARVVADQPWNFSLDVRGSLEVARPVQAGTVQEHDDVLAQLPTETGDFVFSTAAWTIRDWPQAEMTGPVAVALYGVNATLGSSTFVTGRWQDEDYVHDPIGWGHGGMWHRYVLLVFADEAALHFSSPHHAPWSFHVTELVGDWRGDLELSQAKGEGIINGTPIPRQQHLFQVIGDFEAEVNYHGSPGEWKLEGSATFLAVDAQTLAGNRYAHLDSDTIVLAAVAGGGVLVLFWRFGPRLLAVLVTRDVWRNKHRAHIARLLTWEPGLSPMDLARRTGLTRASVRRHLDRLESDGFVSKRATSKVPAYTLNSGSSHFQVGEHAVNAHEVFEVMRHPVRQLIVEAIEAGAVDYAGICKYLDDEGHETLRQPTFSRHAKQMADAGVLTRRASGRRVKWKVAVNLQRIRRHYARAFLVQRNCWHVYEALKVPATIDELRKRVGWTGSRRLLTSLRTLEALGLLERAHGKLKAEAI